MKKKLLLIFLVFASSNLCAQYKNTVWCFGDSSGRIVKRQDMPSNAKFLSLDITTLPSGLYFYSVKSNTGLEKTGKFIVE